MNKKLLVTLAGLAMSISASATASGICDDPGATCDTFILPSVGGTPLAGGGGFAYCVYLGYVFDKDEETAAGVGTHIYATSIDHATKTVTWATGITDSYTTEVTCVTPAGY